MFKPTLTVNPKTFRTTRADALSCSVCGDSAYPEDSGFALKGWTKWEVDNAGIFIGGRIANPLGKVHLTDNNGAVTTVDKT